jgi:hypothetical protein
MGLVGNEVSGHPASRMPLSLGYCAFGMFKFVVMGYLIVPHANALECIIVGRGSGVGAFGLTWQEVMLTEKITCQSNGRAVPR